ncbi:acetyl-CoA carboxylase biotin carboxyl carrier protein [Shouchella clausii]|uniref:acetyl-CoA carboxylase biotin carboxyl carrier protein n=1 Tax=Shouchella clausii TaxID=79880 RepID=UPI0031FBF4A2
MLTVEDIEKIITVADKKGYTDVLLKQQGQFELHVKKGEIVAPKKQEQVDKKPAAPEENQADKHERALSEDTLMTITAPMLGTFYRSSGPDEAPFVDIGDHVQESSTVCIIEAMKLMNEVSAGCSGEVVEIFVDNGELVEYGQPLLKIKK